MASTASQGSSARRHVHPSWTACGSQPSGSARPRAFVNAANGSQLSPAHPLGAGGGTQLDEDLRALVEAAKTRRLTAPEVKEMLDAGRGGRLPMCKRPPQQPAGEP